MDTAGGFLRAGCGLVWAGRGLVRWPWVGRRLIPASVMVPKVVSGWLRA